jgi:hypothetical protein
MPRECHIYLSFIYGPARMAAMAEPLCCWDVERAEIG